jgi:hypothetical protein
MKLLVCAMLLILQDPFGLAMHDAVLRGRVMVPGGAPYVQATLELRSHDGAFFETTTSREGGRFEFRGLEAGTYDLTVTGPAAGPFRCEVEVRGAVENVDVEVPVVRRRR